VLSETPGVTLYHNKATIKSANILILEDESLLALSIQKSLESLGYQISGFASSGDQALQVAERSTPDLALVDIKIRGDKDGIETARLLRDRHGIPSIFLTAHSDSSTWERAKVSEPFGYLIKPYTLKELRSAVEIGLLKNSIEQDLRRSKGELTSILGGLGDAIISCEPTGTIRYLNRAAVTLLNCTRESSLIGKKLEDICSLNHLVTGQPLKLFQQRTSQVSILPTQDTRLECTLTRGGETRIVEFSIAKLGTKEDLERGSSLLVIRDITQQKQATNHQRALESQLFRAQKMQAIGQLAGGIAHDFNNLLTAIMGNLALLREPHDRTDMSERLGATEQACVRAADLVGKLLAFSRKTPEQFSNICIAELAKEVLSLVKNSFPEKVVMTFSPSDELPCVYADPNQVHQVLMNLLLNARDAIKTKLSQNQASTDVSQKINVQIFAIEANRYTGTTPFLPLPPEHFVVIAIEDTGIGMTASVLQKIYEPFFTTKGIGNGTGLGMSAVYGIINRLNGWVDISSMPGVGTSVKVYLPVSQSSTEENNLIKKFEISSKPSKTVLIVSRDQLLRDLLASRARNLECEPLLTDSFEQALNVLTTENSAVRLIICDSCLAPENLDHFIGNLRSHIPQLKVLILDNLNTPLHVLEGKTYDDFDCVFLPKPPHPETNQRIEKHLKALSIDT
jgi:two-component system, cell cycle sensor histidine kinase and response regulator CckA